MLKPAASLMSLQSSGSTELGSVWSRAGSWANCLCVALGLSCYLQGREGSYLQERLARMVAASKLAVPAWASVGASPRVWMSSMGPVAHIQAPGKEKRTWLPLLLPLQDDRSSISLSSATYFFVCTGD